MNKFKLFIVIIATLLLIGIITSCSSSNTSGSVTGESVEEAKSQGSKKPATNKPADVKSELNDEDNINEDGKQNPADESGNTRLTFKNTLSYDYLKSLDGKSVSINGYLATSSPVDGSFIFLMNMPYQSCPFCVPNTTELSNTIEVYPKSGERFSYTTSAVKVKGTLKVAPKDEPFTDPYGYTFSFKIVDAVYEVLTSEDMGTDFGIWEKFSQSGIIDELYKMYDYVDFICKWNEYFVNSYTNANGVTQPGFYLWPSDAKNYLEKGNMKYGTDPNYFSNLITKIEAIDKDAFKDLVDNVKEAEALAKVAYDKLYNGEYTKENKFVEKFGTYDDIYTIVGGDYLKISLDDIFSGFQEWLGSWEL